MLRFGTKLGSETFSEWRCCFCLHVRTGTILLGAWHLLLHLIALGFVAAIVRDPHILDDINKSNSPDVTEWSNFGPELPTPLSNVESKPSPYPNRYNPSIGNGDHFVVYDDVDMGALVTVCTLTTTLMLIYGAARGNATFMLPFFCLQIFDFAIIVLTATGYVCYLRSVHRLVADARRVPWRDELLQLPAPALAFIVVSVLLFAIMIKAYWINVVWRCYKYLTIRANSMIRIEPSIISREGLSPPVTPCMPPPAPDYNTLLPKYEDAVKQSPPPPSYLVATQLAEQNVQEPRPQQPQQQAPAVAVNNTVVTIPEQSSNQAQV